MKIARNLLCLLIAVAMLFSLAACGDTNTTNSGSGTATSNVGARFDSDGNLLYKPEDVGELDNPIVRALIPWSISDETWQLEYQWKEDAYGLEMDLETCPWTERQTKLVAAYVSGTAYDYTRIDFFPTVVIKGLVQSFDEYIDLTDERYFNTQTTDNFTWDGKHYAMEVKSSDSDVNRNRELYGVWFNIDHFEDVGEKTPLEYYEEGEWTYANFINAAKALQQDVDRDGVIDIIGFGYSSNDFWVVCNGAKTVDFADGKINLTWNDPKYIEGLQYSVDAKPYGSVIKFADFMNGKSAMFIERVQSSATIAKSGSNFSFDWVPLPNGPSGNGEQLKLIGGNALCAGAKNVQGALTWLCADLCKYDYISTDAVPACATAEQLERANEVAHLATTERYSDIGDLENRAWSFWSAVNSMGPKAAIEKFTNVYQAQIDIVLSEEKIEQAPYKSPGTVDFENDDVVLKEIYENTLSITSDPNEVINGSKSLKIQLVPENDYGPVATTTSDDFSMPFGGQYKITFKAKAVGGTAKPEGTLLVEFRPSSDAALTENATKFSGYNPVDLSSGEVVNVEIMINVVDYYNDLQVVLIGNTDDADPNLAVIIDDFAVEKIEA